MYELIEPLARTAGIDGVVAEKPAIIAIDILQADGPRWTQQLAIRERFASGRSQSEADRMARSRQAHPA
jgi:hypothetical protein